MLKEDDAKVLIETNTTDSSLVNQANEIQNQKSTDPTIRVKDMITTLMKGAATVGNIFPSKSDDAELLYDKISETSPGVFEIKNIRIKTKKA